MVRSSSGNSVFTRARCRTSSSELLEDTHLIRPKECV